MAMPAAILFETSVTTATLSVSGFIALEICGKAEELFAQIPQAAGFRRINSVGFHASSLHRVHIGCGLPGIILVERCDVVVFAIHTADIVELRAGCAPDDGGSTLLNALLSLGRVNDRITVFVEPSRLSDLLPRHMLASPVSTIPPGCRENARTFSL
jgi:hypothetical protein